MLEGKKCLTHEAAVDVLCCAEIIHEFDGGSYTVYELEHKENGKVMLILPVSGSAMLCPI